MGHLFTYLYINYLPDDGFFHQFVHPLSFIKISEQVGKKGVGSESIGIPKCWQILVQL